MDLKDWRSQKMQNNADTNVNYGPFARMYHNLFGNRTDDFNFYIGLAKKMGSPILELGSGTGRLLIPLAKQGYNVHGLELQQGMLDFAKEEIEKAGKEIQKRVTLHLGDMRNFSLPYQFNLVIIAFSTWHELHTGGNRKQTLSCIFQHLKQGGCLAIDNKIYSAKDPRYGLLRHRMTTFESNEIVTCFDVNTFDEKSINCNIRKLVFVDRVVPSEGNMKRQVYEFVFTYQPADKVIAELKQAGFSEVEVYGGLNYEPLDSTSKRQVFLARKE